MRYVGLRGFHSGVAPNAQPVLFTCVVLCSFLSWHG